MLAIRQVSMLFCKDQRTRDLLNGWSVRTLLCLVFE
jgi:hypothetical protein